MYPAVSMQDSDYKVNYMAYDSDKDQFINKFIIYDHTTNAQKES